MNPKKTSFLLVLVISLITSACEKEKKETEVPVAIKKLIETYDDNCVCQPFISEYKWKNETVYLSSCGGPACDCTTTFYNAQGTEINMPTNNNEFQSQSTFVKEVWTCK
ncbi:hypothetical protein [Desertivirga arenae]|uniref:hypothetical protein n=1 Tax=Desertivirga arenae TaxID=2810309 RepID=UPI001A9634B2|nr:hypothetical protein [Pedobacter sp. SYSU D00823]